MPKYALLSYADWPYAPEMVPFAMKGGPSCATLPCHIWSICGEHLAYPRMGWGAAWGNAELRVGDDAYGFLRVTAFNEGEYCTWDCIECEDAGLYNRLGSCWGGTPAPGRLMMDAS